MKKSRFTEEQIVRILAEFAGGKKAAEISRQYQISESTLFRWKQKYSGMTHRSCAGSKNWKRKTRV